MAVVFGEDTEGAANLYEENKLPDAFNDLCPAWNALPESDW
jgi:hypothetical protein